MNVRLEGKEQSKPVAIIDRQLNLDKTARIFSTASHCHIYHCDERKGFYPNSSFYLMPMKNKAMDLSAVIRHLGELGYHDVWVEAGGAIFSALHKEGLVHRTYLYLVPTSLEQNAISAYQQQGLFERPHTLSWHAMGDNMVLCIDWRSGLNEVV
jgi:diaminohydroxyphosphoribosylaminopyrimidine deaminase/5-amino-6-(5-phosphoribosylamino)uracil reductase